MKKSLLRTRPCRPGGTWQGLHGDEENVGLGPHAHAAEAQAQAMLESLDRPTEYGAGEEGLPAVGDHHAAAAHVPLHPDAGHRRGHPPQRSAENQGGDREPSRSPIPSDGGHC